MLEELMNLLRAQNKMKTLVDQHRRDAHFNEGGDLVVYVSQTLLPPFLSKLFSE